MRHEVPTLYGPTKQAAEELAQRRALLYRLLKTHFPEGYGLQAVHKCLAMNSALAAEGRFPSPAPACRGKQHFFRKLFSRAARSMRSERALQTAEKLAVG
jgi:hypothetical protein